MDPTGPVGEELSDEQKIRIAKWFLLNSPPGEIQYVAKDLQGVLSNDVIYQAAAREAFPIHNKEQLLSVEMSDGSGHVLVCQYGEISINHFIELRTAQVATINHIKQVCTGVRLATDSELPSTYPEGYRSAIDSEVMRYVEEAFPAGHCAVYVTKGKDVDDSGCFELTIVISSAKLSPKNFCNGRWRSIWVAQFDNGLRTVELKGHIKISAHYFEDGNVQLDTVYDDKESTILQGPSETASAVVTIIQNFESAYLACLEELRRKLPITRTLFPWHTARQLSMNRELTREMSNK